MAQKISIDPTLWARARILAFNTGTTATKLVEAALLEYLPKVEKDRDGLATKVGDDPDTKAELTRVATQIAVLDNHDVEKPIGKVTKITETAAGLTVEAERVSPKVGVGAVITEAKLHEVAVVEDSPFGPVKVVSTPEEAKAAVAALPQRRAFTPVPKPVSPKKASRARR